MITFSEIKKAINAKLKEICPDVAIYGKEVSEGERKPCFYPYIMPKGKNYETRNFAQSGLTLKVTYMQDQKDEVDMLEKQDALEKGFGMSLKVGNRSLLASDVGFVHRTVQQAFCLLSAERFRMAAACALAIISGIVIYNIRTAKPAGLAVRLFTRGEKRQAYFSTLLSRMRSLSRFLPAFSRNFSSKSSTVILLRAAPFTSNTMRPASIIRVRLPSSSA